MKYWLFVVMMSTRMMAMAGEWTATDKALLATSVIELGVDWAQTRYIAAHPYHFSEKNPLLGRHPSTEKVNWYFAGSIAGTVGLSMALPPKYRRIFLGGLVLMETAVIVHNNHIGIGMKF